MREKHCRSLEGSQPGSTLPGGSYSRVTGSWPTLLPREVFSQDTSSRPPAALLVIREHLSSAADPSSAVIQSQEVLDPLCHPHTTATCSSSEIALRLCRQARKSTLSEATTAALLQISSVHRCVKRKSKASATRHAEDFHPASVQPRRPTRVSAPSYIACWAIALHELVTNACHKRVSTGACIAQAKFDFKLL